MIVEIDGKKVIDPSELPRMVALGHIGKTVVVKVFRQGKSLEVKAVIEARPGK